MEWSFEIRSKNSVLICKSAKVEGAGVEWRVRSERAEGAILESSRNLEGERSKNRGTKRESPQRST